MIFQPTCPSSKWQMVRAISGQFRAEGRTPPWTRHCPSQGTLAPTPTLRLGQFRQANSPHTPIFGMWQKTRVPGENHADKGQGSILYFPHQRYRETTLNATMLSENLLYFSVVFRSYYTQKTTQHTGVEKGACP